MKVHLVSVTKGVAGSGTEDLSPEELVVYCARVSSPMNQLNTETAPKLIRYLIKKKHWSPFEMVDLTFEITTSRAVAAQILRHRSFSFQEFSQRYAVSSCVFESQEARVSGGSNRQGSLPADEILDARWQGKLKRVQRIATETYEYALSQGIAPEVARMALPLGVQTRMYMKGSVRSWLHYLQVRCAPDVQKEHRDIALAIKEIFTRLLPNIAEAAFTEEAK